jgi:hypothetical protein
LEVVRSSTAIRHLVVGVSGRALLHLRPRLPPRCAALLRVSAAGAHAMPSAEAPMPIWRGRWGAAERARVAQHPAHGRAPPTHVLGTASSPAHRVRSCGHTPVQ